MNFSKKQLFALSLALVFSASFLIVFLTILFTQSAYSMPSSYVSVVNEMDITLGPPPNSTNIPINTAITVDALASASLNDLHVTPEVNFANVASGTTGILTYRTTFYPAKLLEPATSYTISVTIEGAPTSWSFTTTTEPFRPGISYYLATNELWIALSTAVSATAIAGFAMWVKGRRV